MHILILLIIFTQSFCDKYATLTLMTEKILNNLELKDFEEAKGIVSFYYSAFNNIDLVGDIVTPSAFLKTVSENFKHIYHNRDHSEAVGKPLEFGQDMKGAFVVSQLATKTEDGADCFEQYKAGIIKGHSMEYKAVKWSYDEVKDIRTITEAKLWGVTSVTNIPANLEATTISIKSFTDIKYSMEEIEKFLRKGNISEKSGKSFLLEFDKLSLQAKSLKDKLKADGITFDENNEPNEAKSIQSINYLITNLKTK